MTLTKTRRTARGLLIALLLAGHVVAQKKPKDPPAPTQPAIHESCIIVSEIRSHKRSFTVSPGIDGTVWSGCEGTVHVSMTIAYYDAKGAQFATGYEMGEIAAGTTWKFRHGPIMDSHQAALRSAKIISVLVNSR